MQFKNQIATIYKSLQNDICEGLSRLDKNLSIQEDHWQREEGGYGITRICKGDIIEHGGVNFSEVYGKLSPEASSALLVESQDFFATGISIVLHPHNPWIPIIHMNVRYFELNDEIAWFGGGIDLTPHYVDIDLAKEFHQGLKSICDRYEIGFYEKSKKIADDYFYLPHRKETRGIGGIFFDRLKCNLISEKSRKLEFTSELAQEFVPIYSQQLKNNVNKPFSEEERKWQLIRRGRYVEFNLLYDRGTKFGLETGGRTESILMSLPNQAHWVYDFHPSIGSLEYKTQKLLIKGNNWL